MGVHLHIYYFLSLLCRFTTLVSPCLFSVKEIFDLWIVETGYVSRDIQTVQSFYSLQLSILIN